MVKFVLISIAILFVTCFAFSQTRSGFVVKTNGDTIRGSIYLARTEYTAQFVEMDQNGARIEYTPSDLSAFEVGDSRYIAARVEIDRSPRTLREFDKSVEGRGISTESLFLQTYQVGKASLYRYVDERSNFHYFVGIDGRIEELRVRVQLIFQNGADVLVTYPVYRDQLHRMFADCPEADKLIDKAGYDLASLRKVMTKFNACHSEVESEVMKKDKGPSFIPGIGLGFINSKFNNDPKAAMPAGAASYSSSSSFVPMAYLLIRSGRTRGQLAISNELTYYSVSYTSKEQPLPNRPYFYSLDYLRYNVGFRLSTPLEKAGIVYAQLGFGMGKALSKSYYSGPGGPFVPSSRDSGIQLIIGTQLKLVGLQLRLDRAAGFSEAVGFATRTLHTGAMLTIDLSRGKASRKH